MTRSRNRYTALQDAPPSLERKTSPVLERTNTLLRDRGLMPILMKAVLARLSTSITLHSFAQLVVLSARRGVSTYSVHRSTASNAISVIYSPGINWLQVTPPLLLPKSPWPRVPIKSTFGFRGSVTIRLTSIAARTVFLFFSPTKSARDCHESP